jgi:hypothetical protein
VDAAPELTTAPSVRRDDLEEVLEAPRKSKAAAKLKKPSAPILAREIVDYLLGRYEWNPGDWRLILTSLAYVQRLGRYFSLQTRNR